MTTNWIVHTQCEVYSKRTRTTNLIRTKSCIMNLCTAFVGCVMYTLPFPSLKLVCQQVNPSKPRTNIQTDLLHDIGQRGGMVEMKAACVTNERLAWTTIPNVLRDQNGIHSTPVKFIDERERSHSAVGRVNPSITDDGLSSVLEYTTGPPDLLTSPKQSHTQRRRVCHSF